MTNQELIDRQNILLSKTNLEITGLQNKNISIDESVVQSNAQIDSWNAEKSSNLDKISDLEITITAINETISYLSQ